MVVRYSVNADVKMVMVSTDLYFLVALDTEIVYDFGGMALVVK